MAANREDIKRLAIAVLKQWYKDGCPVDFSYLDTSAPTLGTWEDFWKDAFMFLHSEKEPGPIDWTKITVPDLPLEEFYTGFNRARYFGKGYYAKQR